MRGTVVLHMFMMVHRQLEESVNLCLYQKAIAANTDIEMEPVRALDKAVAYHTGSLEGKVANDSEDGHLLFFLANIMCSHFNTCKEEDSSLINEDIFFYFNNLKENYVNDEDCDKAEHAVEHNLMKKLQVPLVQATLLSAYFQQHEKQSSSGANAEGAMYAASILPLVHACSAADATLIYEQMKLGRESTVDFAIVKQALERNYQCMGVSCFEIGGVYIHFRHPEGAEPCADIESEGNSSSRVPVDSGGSQSSFESEESSSDIVPVDSGGSQNPSTGSEGTPSTPTLLGIAASTYEPLGSYTPTTFVADHVRHSLSGAPGYSTRPVLLTSSCLLSSCRLPLQWIKPNWNTP